MQLQIDPNRSYALALEGGGAKGGYEIGAWIALRDAGISIDAVSGTSVGALNGALIAMGDAQAAQEIWRNIRYSQVMDVDDELMDKLLQRNLKLSDLRMALDTMKKVLDNRGFDVSPLYDWMRQVVDEDAVRASPVELYIVTYSMGARRELELRAKDLPQGMLHDMLLASAYLPVFRSERVEGKYADGGLTDVLPLHVLFTRGHRDIIALRVFGIGRERRVRIPGDVTIHTVSPTVDLGSTLEFTAEQSRFNLKAGYYDAQRLLYGLAGRSWYMDAQWTEKQAYDFLLASTEQFLSGLGVKASLRELHERRLPQLAGALGVKRGDYRDVLLALLEAGAEEAGLERWRVYTEEELIGSLGEGLFSESARRGLEPPRGLKRLRTLI